MKGAAVTLAPHTPEQPHPSRALRGLRLHDLAGSRTQIVHPDGALFNIWYDPGSSLGQAGLNRPYYLFHSGWSGMAYVSYNAIGAPGAMGHAATTSYGYDGVQRPASLAHNFSGGTGLVVWTYGRNPAGQLSTIARDNDAFAWTGHYGVQRPYTTNGRNQYSAAGPTTLAYDDNGNLLSETTANVTRTYAYDIENRLIGASVPGGSQVQLGYDPLGRLSWTTGSPDFTRFLYDGDALVAEYDYAGTIMTKRYAHWVGQPAPAEAGVPMVSYEGASLENAMGRWLIADHQGSIVAAAHPSGATDWVNTYDEYGIPGAGNQGRFQYTGQIWLAELGMYHYKARVYSPTLGRFLQTDPIGYNDQFNLYAYVGNDPLNRTDPTGRKIAVEPGQEEEVLRNLHPRTRSTYKVEGGFLRVARRRTQTYTGSRIARLSTFDRMLTEGIQASTVLRIQFVDVDTPINDPRLGRVTIYHQRLAGGVTYQEEDGSLRVYVGRRTVLNGPRDVSGRYMRYTPADVLMHEFTEHGIPGMLGQGLDHGLVNENAARRDLGLPERGPDEDHLRGD